MSSVSPTQNASDMQMDYMKLLITQLQNQNPLDPMDNSDMTSQLTQFSSLSQLEQMNLGFKSMDAKFEDLLFAANRTYASSLIGKEISFYGETEEGEINIVTEPVRQISLDPDTGEYRLQTTTYTLGIKDVLSVSDSESSAG